MSPESANSRSAILGRIRSALREESPAPPPAPDGRALFKPIPSADLPARFQLEFEALKGGFAAANNWDEARQALQRIAQANGFTKIAAMPHADVEDAARGLNPKILTGEGDCGHALADFELGITACDFLIARTGSVVLSTRTGFGRALSVLPPAHLALARRSQIVSDPADAYRGLQARYGNAWPSMMTVISGPSRTADIEKILVLGAHGPKQLFVVLLNF